MTEHPNIRFGVLAENIDVLIRAAEKAVVDAKTLKRGRGRPFATRHLKLYPFFEHIEGATDRRLTFDRNTRKGTAIEFINKLRPYLPPDFLPRDYVQAFRKFRDRAVSNGNGR